MSEPIQVFAGNWKMHYTPSEAIQFFKSLKDGVPKSSKRRNVIFPVAYALSLPVHQVAQIANIELGAQNVHWELSGAFTGELSAQALVSIGIDWVLVAHSERRQFFGETDETAGKRFHTAASHGLNVIYCIGETLAEREAGKMEEVLKRQLQPFISTFNALKGQQKELLWCIAYEPVWAIGTGKTASNDQAEQAHRYIRGELTEALGSSPAEKIPLLYGGSVKPENASGLLSQPNINGVLVGGASLKPDSFRQILESQ